MVTQGALDRRLGSLVGLVRHAVLTLKAHTSGATIADLVPPELAATPSIRKHARPILEFFGIIERDDDATRLYRPRVATSRGEVRRRFRALQLLLWNVSSLRNDRLDTVQRRARIEALLASYGYPQSWYDGLFSCLKAIELVEGVPGRAGGYGLLAVASAHRERAGEPEARPQSRVVQLPDRALERAGQQAREVHEIPIPGANRPIDLLASLTALFQLPRRKHQSPPLPIHLRPDRVPIEYEEFRGWKVRTGKRALHRDWKDYPDLQDVGDWRNPDLIGFRYENSAPILEIELLAVQAVGDGKFNRAAIAQAVAYRDFANIVYLAVAQPGEELLSRKILMNEIRRAGIGLIARSTRGWEEFATPSFQHQRGFVRSYYLEHFFGRETMERLEQDLWSRIGSRVEKTNQVG